MTPGDDHRALAALLDETAAVVPGLLEELAAHDRPDVWTGRRSDRFGEALADRIRLARVTADELRAQAQEVRSRAELYDLLVGPGAP